MTLTERIAVSFCWFAAWVMVVFLLAPIVIVVGVAFSSSTVFDFPPPGLSLKWFERIGSLPGFWDTLARSLQIAAVSTGIAMVIGTLLAIAVVTTRFPGRTAVTGLALSPLMLPGLVTGIAMLQFWRALDVFESYPTLIVAHVVITLPYIVRVVVASLQLFDFSLLDAARTLGCSPGGAIVRVMVPVLAPGFFAGGLFAFLASFDNYPISMFLADARSKTFPLAMIEYVETSTNPTVAAVSALLVGLTILVLVVGDRLVGLRRMAGV